MLSEFSEASRAHLARLDKIVTRGSVPRLRRVYEDAASDLERSLSRAIGSGASPFTVHQHQILLAQVRQGLARLSGALGHELGAQARVAQVASANSVIENIKLLEHAAGASATQLPIEQAAKFAGVVDRRRTSLLALNKTSMTRYGAGVVQQVEGALSKSLLAGETGHKAIDRVSSVVSGEWWRAERIARTETAWAYNATQLDATAETVQVFPDIMTRWTEMVADITLTKMDPRVGDDSCAMHGQLARPGDSFGMPSVNPPNLRVSESLVGRTWTNPPNRPNDRAVLQPWRPGWGWGWVLVDGARGPAPTKVQAAPTRRRQEPPIDAGDAGPIPEVAQEAPRRVRRSVQVPAPQIRDLEIGQPPPSAQVPTPPQVRVWEGRPAAAGAAWPKEPVTRLPGEEPVAKLPGESEEPAWAEHRIGMGRIPVIDPDVLELEESPERPFAIGLHHVRGADETDEAELEDERKPAVEERMTGAKSIWAPGDEARQPRQVVFLESKERRVDLAAEREKEIAKQARQRAEWETKRPLQEPPSPVPAGFEFPEARAVAKQKGVLSRIGAALRRMAGR